jgi:type I restriction enzyme S subunit
MLASIPMPLPPLTEQERIVKLLDEADELRKLRAQADCRTTDLIPALFYEMFGEVDSNSKQWPMVPFAEVGESRLGKMLDAKQQTGQYKRLYLRNANVQWNRLDLGGMLEMDFSESDRKEFRLRYGDLLICEGGEVGRAAIWRDELPECYFQKALHRVRLHPSKAIPEFVLHLLQAIATTNGFRDYVGSSTIPHLTGVKLASIRIPLPPLMLQKEFAARVSDICAMQAEQAASRRRLDDLFQSMLHRAFNGEL